MPGHRHTQRTPPGRAVQERQGEGPGSWSTAKVLGPRQKEGRAFHHHLGTQGQRGAGAAGLRHSCSSPHPHTGQACDPLTPAGPGNGPSTRTWRVDKHGHVSKSSSQPSPLSGYGQWVHLCCPCWTVVAPGEPVTLVLGKPLLGLCCPG